MRYKVDEGSQSGHCCFEATVVDTEVARPIAGTLLGATEVCECRSVGIAELVAAAMNDADRVVRKQCGPITDVERERMSALLNDREPPVEG